MTVTSNGWETTASIRRPNDRESDHGSNADCRGRRTLADVKAHVSGVCECIDRGCTRAGLGHRPAFVIREHHGRGANRLASMSPLPTLRHLGMVGLLDPVRAVAAGGE